MRVTVGLDVNWQLHTSIIRSFPKSPSRAKQGKAIDGLTAHLALDLSEVRSHLGSYGHLYVRSVREMSLGPALSCRQGPVTEHRSPHFIAGLPLVVNGPAGLR